jgi:hypothetical protein
LASPSSLCSQNQETLETLEKNPMKCERSERHLVAMGAILINSFDTLIFNVDKINSLSLIILINGSLIIDSFIVSII